MKIFPKLVCRILLIGLLWQASSGVVSADEIAQEIRNAVEALNAGRVNEARESIAKLEPQESLEVRYLTARLQSASDGRFFAESSGSALN